MLLLGCPAPVVVLLSPGYLVHIAGLFLPGGPDLVVVVLPPGLHVVVVLSFHGVSSQLALGSVAVLGCLI